MKPSRAKNPRVITHGEGDHFFYGTYRKHYITITRDDRHESWYIQVTDEDGYHSYDGWWIGSDDRTRREAVLEALEGSLLWEPTKKDPTK